MQETETKTKYVFLVNHRIALRKCWFPDTGRGPGLPGRAASARHVIFPAHLLTRFAPLPPVSLPNQSARGIFLFSFLLLLLLSNRVIKKKRPTKM